MFSKETLEVLYAILMKIQITVGGPTFEQDAARIGKAKKELEAALAPFQKKKLPRLAQKPGKK